MENYRYKEIVNGLLEKSQRLIEARLGQYGQTSVHVTFGGDNDSISQVGTIDAKVFNVGEPMVYHKRLFSIFLMIYSSADENGLRLVIKVWDSTTSIAGGASVYTLFNNISQLDESLFKIIESRGDRVNSGDRQ